MISRDSNEIERSTALDDLTIADAPEEQFEARLRETSELLRATLEHMDQGLIYYGPDQRVRVHNRRACEIIDLPPSVLHDGARMADVHRFLIGRGEFAGDVDHLGRMVESGAQSSSPGVFERVRPNGVTMEVRGTRLGDGGVVWTFTDISARKEAERRITHIALHDGLTGLANRTLFNERLRQGLADARRTGEAFAVLACDLDRFKRVNDTHGHPAGDRLLCIVADRLRAVVPDGATIARLGGDEFAVVLGRPHGTEAADKLARRIIGTIAEPIDLGGLIVGVGASVGIALATATCEDADDLFRSADIALYRAKAAGRNTHSFYDPGLTDAQNFPFGRSLPSAEVVIP